MSKEKWMVCNVTSGDRVQIMQPTKPSGAPKKFMFVSQIKAPKTAKIQDGLPIPDDPWGWEAREFVRKRLIGKTVMVTKENETPGGDYIGQIEYKGENNEVANIGVDLVAQGMAAPDIRTKDKKSEYSAKLEAAFQHAKDNKLGFFSDDEPEGRLLRYDPPDPEFIKELTAGRLSKQNVIIEHIIGPTRFKVLILPFHQLCVMDLAGVSTYDPAMRDAPEQKQVDAEAMQAAEKDLLGRELTVLVEGKSDKGFMATIQSGDRVYQEEMVKKGWARVIGQCSFSTRLAEAEAQAKSKKIGRWVKYEPKPEEKKLQEEKQKKASGGGVTFSGQIMQIIDPCFVAVWNEDKKCKEELNIAGVRCGLEIPGDGRSKWLFASRTKKVESYQYSNYFWEAKEHLRKLTAGKKAKVTTEFIVTIKNKEDNRETSRPACSIVLEDGTDVAVKMAEDGCVFPFTLDGVPSNGGAIESAANRAKSKEPRIGIWKDLKVFPTHTVRDMSRPKDDQGQLLLRSLRGKTKAVVEYALGAARCKMYIPSQSCLISFNLSGLIAPQRAMEEGDHSDPLGEEAYRHTCLRLNNRDVEIQIDRFFKGSFMGALYLDGKDYALELLSEGLAVLMGNNTEKSYADAQEQAWKAKKGVHSAGLPKRAKGTVKEALTRGENKQEEACVTEVVDSNCFFFQKKSEVGNLRRVEEFMKRHDFASMDEAKSVKRGDVVAARFSKDHTWYRAKVLKEGYVDAEVRYIDYGNKEILPIKEMRFVPELTKFVEQVPALAHEGMMAFMYPLPATTEAGREAAQLVRDFTSQPGVTVAHEYTDARKNKYYTVRANKRAVQQELLYHGLGYVAVDVQDYDEYKKPVEVLTKLEQEAKAGKFGVWTSGDSDPRVQLDEYEY